jgi:ATP-dependent helicase/nuclease subunit A
VATREVSVVLSSGAGCGKTHVLTERYLAHLRDGEVEVSQIVAITFTDRAARQMRQRIRKALTQELRAARTDAEAERWGRHLRGLESAPISTIHAFCANLLRQHAVEAGLDPQFNVLEEVLSLNLEEEALTACLQRLLTADSPEGEDLRQLILLYGWKPVVTGAQHLMHTAAMAAWEEWLERPAEPIASGWLQFAREQLWPRYVEHVLTASPKVVHCLELLRRARPRPDSKMADKVRRLLDQAPKLAEASDLAAAIAELVECAKVGGERAKAWPSEEAYEQIKDAFEGFRAELPCRMQLFLEEPEHLTDAARTGRRFVRVAAEAVRTYRQHKRRNGVVDFQDLLVLTRDLLKDRAEIRERLQRRYWVLLIDELQDTDPVQIELVEALCGGGLETGKLFAVGDHKQSIYRFRGADSSLFRDLRNRMPHEGRLDLTVNFRSQPAVLDFTNALLGHRMTEYEPLVAHHRQVNPGPCIEFLWSPRGDKELVNEARSREADWIARRIANMVSGEALVVEGLPKDPRLRPVRQGDIVLLFRAMTNVQLYEKALRKYGLDYYLVGGRAFFAQQEIYDLLNLLRALENPQDAVSLAGTLRSPFCCLSDEALFLLNRHQAGLWAGLHDDALLGGLPADYRETVARARRYLDRWRSLKDRLPIVRLLGEVFADSGYDAAMQFEILGDRKLANLWKLMDLARTFDRSALFGLAEFIYRLGDLVRTQPREEQAATQPENADVVRLMTIHQAKGLEFPVVVIPDVAATGGGPHYPVVTWDARLGSVVRPPADEEPPPFSPFAWELWKAAESIEEWHEDLRTLYVACTRAQDYLVLSAALPPDYRPANAWMSTLTERFDLRTGACRAPGIPAEKIPLVRVTDSRTPPPEPGTRLSGKRLPEGEESEMSHLAMTAIPIRLTGGEVLTVGQIEPYLRRAGGVFQPSDLAWQFDTEDGSDRTAWVTPRRRLDGLRDAAAERRDRLLRLVLERWDFQGAGAWKGLLRQATGAPTSAELEPLFAGFAASPAFRLLADAKVCYRDVEFLTTLNGVGCGPLKIRGMIDFLCQDERGDWHVLTWTAERVSAEEREPDWRCREPGLALAAQAVHQNQGAWPKSVTLYYFAEGTEITQAGQRLRRPEILTRLAAQLTDILGRRLGRLDS